MQRVKMKKNFGSYLRGMAYTVGNNEAHTLIDKGLAELYKDKAIEAPAKDKMFKKKRAKIK